MDQIKFAALISYLTAIRQTSDMGFSQYEITQIKESIQDILLIPDWPKTDLQPLFSLLVGRRKLEAIREYRAISGNGLLESKNAIESLMNQFTYPEPTLGDILKTTTS